MIEVKIIDTTASQAMEIAKELKDRGYVMGVDFDFSYHPPKYDYFSNDAVYNRHTIFTFYKEELASWFSLRYQ